VKATRPLGLPLAKHEAGISSESPIIFELSKPKNVADLELPVSHVIFKGCAIRIKPAQALQRSFPGTPPGEGRFVYFRTRAEVRFAIFRQALELA
jgi:hypothetical protein